MWTGTRRSVTSWNRMPANGTFVSVSCFFSPHAGQICSKINDAVDHFPERRLFNVPKLISEKQVVVRILITHCKHMQNTHTHTHILFFVQINLINNN